MRWRIYYGDETTFSNREGTPFEAPRVNAQVIAYETPKGKRPFELLDGRSAYCWSGVDGWNACDEAGMWDYLLTYKGPKAILFGRTVRNKVWQAIHHRAHEEGLG